MKKYPLVILLVVLIAGFGSYYAIPNNQEIALINFKDKRFDEARVMYEKQLEAGKMSPDIAGNLVDLYLQNGDVDKAIDVMEKFVATRQGDLSARVILGQLYQYAQRQDDYLRNLEEIKRMNPTEDVLAKLNEVYHKDAQFEKQLSTLEELVKQGGAQTDGSRLRSVATMQAQAKRWDEAIASMLKLREVAPTEFKFPEHELLVSLYTEKRDDQAALNESKGWASLPDSKGAQLARLGSILHYKASAQLAMQFFSSISSRLQEAPELVTEYVMVMIGLDQRDQAYDLMLQLKNNNQLPEALKRELLFLAIAKNNNELVDELYKSADITQFNESQLITLVELSQVRKDARLLEPLRSAFGTEDALNRFPVFAVVLGLADKAPDSASRIERLHDLPLTSAQRLVVARACARVGNLKCTRDMMGQLGDMSSLSDPEVKDVADLYLITKDYDTGFAFVEKKRAERPSEMLDVAWAKYAAARGDVASLEPWLDSHASLQEQDFKGLYFLASDNHHSDAALLVAERLYARYNSDDVRDFLTSAYIANKNYEKALPMLQAMRNRSAKDEDNYFYILVNLSKKSPKYKAELTDYAVNHLKSAGSERKRLAMIYTLIQAGRADVALPFIKEYATKFGGQWVDVYASNLDKKGLNDEARDFRMEIATRAGASNEVKRQIAYTLLNKGYKQDATTLFYDLASNGSADRRDAEQLLYLWGPRLSAEQVDWVASRALSSNDGMYDFWVERLTTQADAGEMVRFVQTNPDSLNDKRISTRYIQSLATLGLLDGSKSREASMILASQNPDTLREFARTARANSKAPVSRQAYEKLASVAPNDAEAMKGAGLIAFGQADYKKSESYLNGYLAKPEASQDDETYLALFYKAEMLRRKGQKAQANAYYNQCVNAVISKPQRTADMESKALTSMILTGNVENGVQSYRELIARHPNDAGIRADFASALVEIKRYDEARQLLNMPLTQLNPSAGDATIQLPASELEGYRFFAGGNELLLKVRSPQLRRALANPALSEQFDWLGYATEGDDRVLLVAKPGVQLALAPAGQTYDIFPQAGARLAEQEASRQMALRYELLKARIEVETGSAPTAVAKLNDLQRYYPNDAQLLGFTANAENFSGRWKHAVAMLDHAIEIAPENEDIRKLRRDIWLQHAQNVKADFEWLNIGDSDQYLTTLSGRADVNDKTDVSVMVQNDNISAEGIRRADGRVGNFDTSKQRAEITARHELDGSNAVRGSLYANNNFIGAGGAYNFLNAAGETELFLDFRRPTFEFVEGVFDDAVRSRVGIAHTYKPDTKTTLNGALAYNLYDVRYENDVAQSVSFQGQATREIYRKDDLTVAAAYALDAEYRTSEKEGFLATTQPGVTNDYTLFPLDTREVHTLALVAGYDFSEHTHGDLLGGYSVDRFGGHGPLVEGRLTHRMLDDQLEAQVRAGYGQRNGNPQGEATRVGGYLMWRF